jgi:hypothetical protein|tara:strand:+ start:35 stop:172 length:138 start_codon:yes stop_codon:yes gene_type:complete
VGLNLGVSKNFKKIIDDFSLCMKNIDSTRPVYQKGNVFGWIIEKI